MTSGFRTRRIPRERSLGLSSAPSTRLPSASPSPVKRWSGIPGRMAAPLRSLLLVFTLVLVGYVTWKEVFSTGDSSLSYKLPSESTGASSPSYQVASESTGASSFSHEVLLSESSPKRRTALYSIEVVKEYRHDPDAFTQVGHICVSSPLVILSELEFGRLPAFPITAISVNCRSGKVYFLLSHSLLDIFRCCHLSWNDYNQGR